MVAHTSTTITGAQMAMLIENVYLPQGGAALFQGPAGIGKSSIAAHLLHNLQRRTANMGSCMANIGGYQSPDICGWVVPSASPLSKIGMPAWMGPSLNQGVRGAFPALCPAELAHPTVRAVIEKVGANDAIEMLKDNLLTETEFKLYLRHRPIAESVITREDMTVYPYGIAVFDEARSVDQTVFQPLAQLFNERRIGPWELNDRWAIIGLGNGTEHGCNVEDMPRNLENRLAIWDVQPVVSDLLPVWAEAGMHPVFRDFAVAESGMIFTSAVPATAMQYGTVRSWTKAWQDCMNYCKFVMREPNIAEHKGHYMPRDIPVITNIRSGHAAALGLKDAAHAKLFYGIVASRCGEAVAQAFREYVLLAMDRPTMEEILADPTGTEWPVNPAVRVGLIDMIVEHTTLDNLDAIAAFTIGRIEKTAAFPLVQKLSTKLGVAVARNRAFLKLQLWAGPGALTVALGEHGS